MRARNLKPGFFKNEELFKLGPWTMLCYAGLWLLADREGRLEDRPERIRGEIFPYRMRGVCVENMLTSLQHRHFIVRYSVQGRSYIAIPSFRKHQNPNVKEAASTIPAPYENNLDTYEYGTSSAPSPFPLPPSLKNIEQTLSPELAGVVENPGLLSDSIESQEGYPSSSWIRTHHDIWYREVYWCHQNKPRSLTAYDKRISTLMRNGHQTKESAHQFLIEKALEDLTKFRGTSDWDWRRKLHPATWLNGERWNDEPSQAAPASSRSMTAYEKRDAETARLFRERMEAHAPKIQAD
jgi:hypothetical protein